MMIIFIDQTRSFRLNSLNTRSVQDTVDLIGMLFLNVVFISPPTTTSLNHDIVSHVLFSYEPPRQLLAFRLLVLPSL
jgi:hypothetical protein